jgi:hypothetical protein
VQFVEGFATFEKKKKQSKKLDDYRLIQTLVL